MRRPGRTGYLILGVATAVVASVAFDLGQSASPSDRASDLRGLVRHLETDIASCNASVRDSFSAYTEVVQGRHDLLGAAEKIIRGNEPYCTPVANSDLYDLSTYEVPGTLRAFHLQPALQQLATWAFPNGAASISDVGQLLSNPADQASRQDLRTRLATMADLSRSAQGALAVAAADLGTRIDNLDLGAASSLGGGTF